MYILATAYVVFEELSAEFQRIAKAYQPETDVPGPFWAVVFNGKILAIYLDVGEAVKHMLAVKLDMEEGREPKRQMHKDVATVNRKLQQRMEKILRNRESEPEKNS